MIIDETTTRLKKVHCKLLLENQVKCMWPGLKAQLGSGYFLKSFQLLPFGRKSTGPVGVAHTHSTYIRAGGAGRHLTQVPCTGSGKGPIRQWRADRVDRRLLVTKMAEIFFQSSILALMPLIKFLLYSVSVVLGGQMLISKRQMCIRLGSLTITQCKCLNLSQTMW